MGNKRRTRADGKVALTAPEKAAIDDCVKYFEAEKRLFTIAAEGVVSLCMNDPKLKEFIHFIKRRVKDPEHLREKLQRIGLNDKKAGGKPAINVDLSEMSGISLLRRANNSLIFFPDVPFRFILLSISSLICCRGISK